LKIGRALGAGILDLAQATAIGLNLNVIAQAAASGADQRLRSQEDTSFSIPFDPPSLLRRIFDHGGRE
jgi:hypothetical protein